MMPIQKKITFCIILFIQISSLIQAAESVEEKYQTLITKEQEFKDKLLYPVNKQTKEFPVPINSIQGYFDHFIKDQPDSSQLEFKQDIVRFAQGIKIVCSDEALIKAADFLEQKKQSTLQIERDVYALMNLKEFIFRLFNNRPLTCYGSHDSTLFLNDSTYYGGVYFKHRNIGTDKEETPFTLSNILSYAEREISELFGIACETFFVNTGDRKNNGILTTDPYEKTGIYAGLVGPRYENTEQMAYKSLIRDIENRQDGDILLIGDAGGNLKNDFQSIPKLYFRPSTHKERLKLSIVPFFHLANEEAKCRGKKAYLHIVGLGLGVWSLFRDSKASSAEYPWGAPNMHVDPSHHIELTLFIHTCKELIEENEFEHIDAINFSHIHYQPHYVAALFQAKNREDAKKLYTKWDKELLNRRRPEKIHTPNPAHTLYIEKADNRKIKVIFSGRSVADKLTGQDEGKLLIAMYAWDGCSNPGNEYWKGSLGASGDPAAACCSLIAALQNTRINGDNILNNIVKRINQFIQKYPKYKDLMEQQNQVPLPVIPVAASTSTVLTSPSIINPIISEPTPTWTQQLRNLSLHTQISLTLAVAIFCGGFYYYFIHPSMIKNIS